MERRMVVLTMSSKYGGYCVAGLDITNGKWIRLVSEDVETHGALKQNDVIYQNGMCCSPLDVIQVPVIASRPLQYQPENVLIDSEKRWEKLGVIDLKDVFQMHPPESHPYLLGNQYPYITEEKVGALGYSLVLVKVENFVLTHPSPMKTKANFSYRCTEYKNISVTDPVFYTYSDSWFTPEAVLVISLPDSPYPENRFYKFIAKIFPLNS